MTAISLGAGAAAPLQTGSAIPSTPLELIMSATPVTRGVLAILALLSIVSWMIMFAKWLEFRRAQKRNADFMKLFERSQSMDEILHTSRKARGNPVGRVFERGVQFLAETKPALGGSSEHSHRLSGSQVEALHLVLEAQAGAERDALARFVPWLATIGSVSPLLGLLGTVLGVITAFLGIATSGSGNIAAVAPGVAEALTATAGALAVAIPAFFGYNIFASRLNRIEGDLEGFGSELIALMVREGRI
jgi:biopolymer transport protein TolQ